MQGEDKDGKPATPRRARRPAPVLDLSATEVASTPVAPESPAPAPPAPAPVDPEPGPASSAAPPADPPTGKPAMADASGGRANGPGSGWLGAHPYAPVAAGAGAGLLAGLAGAFGLIALGAGPSGNAHLVETEARFRAIDTKIGALADRPAPTIPPAASPEALAAVARQLADLDAQKLAPLADRLARVEADAAAQAARAASQTTEAAAALAVKVTALERALASASEKASDTSAAIAAAEARLRASETAPRLGPEALVPLGERLAALDRQMTGLAALAGRVDALDARAGAAFDPGRATAWPVSLAALRAALDQGRPFGPELAAARALAGASAASLDALAPHAERGLPTLPAIAERFAALVPALIAATPRDEPQGFLDRLARNAEGVVRVRPTGEAQGDKTSAVVGRIDQRLKRGDLAGALDEAKKLAAPVRAAGADWFAAAEARRAADATLARLSAEALAALARAGG